MSIAVELSGITKSFPGVIANDDVNLVVKQGEIHAICGENGAGKSTLMKILYGMIQPDSGEMRVNGETVDFSSPVEAIKSGIGMVHQHFMLADQLSVFGKCNFRLRAYKARWKTRLQKSSRTFTSSFKSLWFDC
ncbi:MAG: hypothetical protein CM15mP49_12870 [Actinomycetota bacterium]|nr:MAG: hypothetical protein CM15mP49_12870 [Actinomycetota bacterium]